MYSCANKEENLENLLLLLENNSKVQIQNQSIIESKLDSTSSFKDLQPKTLGDVVLIQIKSLIDKKIKIISLENNNISFSFNNHDNSVIIGNKVNINDKDNDDKSEKSKEILLGEYLNSLCFFERLFNTLRFCKINFKRNSLNSQDQNRKNILDMNSLSPSKNKCNNNNEGNDSANLNNTKEDLSSPDLKNKLITSPETDQKLKKPKFKLIENSKLQLNNSIFKAHYILIIFNTISSNKYLTKNFLANESFMKLILDYIEYISKESNIPYFKLIQEQIILGLVLLSNVYIINIELRMLFIKLNGLSIIKNCLTAESEVLIHRGLCAVEDLVYNDSDESNDMEIEDLILKEIVIILVDNKIDFIITKLMSDEDNPLENFLLSDNRRDHTSKSVLSSSINSGVFRQNNYSFSLKKNNFKNTKFKELAWRLVSVLKMEANE